MTQQLTTSYPLPPLTPEEQEQWRIGLERAAQLRAELLAARGGKFFPPSGRFVDEMRAEAERRFQ